MFERFADRLFQGIIADLPAWIAAAVAVAMVPLFRTRRWAGVATILAAALAAGGLAFLSYSRGNDRFHLETTLAALVSGLAVALALAMATRPDPAYAALAFALTVLATSATFAFNGAWFLAASSVIVYAGAIIVTFLFVLMLASHGGKSVYDRSVRSAWPAAAISGAVFALVAGPLMRLPEPVRLEPDPGFGTVASLGLSLWGPKHLLAVELAGTLLLVATVGAVVVGMRRAPAP